MLLRPQVELMNQYVLWSNTGSSSLKFALYDQRDLETVVMHGLADRIGSGHSRLRIETQSGLLRDEEISLPTTRGPFKETLHALQQAPLPKPTACVHRVVHGGPRLIEPVLITDTVKQELKNLVALAPLHLPSEIAVIEAASNAYPDIPQIACFDTAFHSRMPEVAKRLPLARHLWDTGIRRYGFHGLSFEYVVSESKNSSLAERSSPISEMAAAWPH